MAEHRKPTAHEVNALQALYQANAIALMPITFNGQERFAVVLLEEGERGEYVQLIGILPIPEDVILDSGGHAPTEVPPAIKSELN